MAEAVVSYVLGRISEATYQEALKLYGMGENIEWAKRELKWVGAFLKDAGQKQNKDERVKEWVKEVRGVAYMIEDALDKFLVEVEGYSKKGILERACKMPKELYARRKVANEIDNIKKRMGEIKENCTNFRILSIESSSGDHIKQPAQPIIIPEIDSTDIVGFKDDVDNICNLLINEKHLRRYVISIVGAGGRGKTTVATKIYNSAKVEHHFQIRLWLTISKEYQLIDVLKKMLRKLRVEDANIQELEECIEKIYVSLKEKRYLVVLDDVWSTDLWTQLEVVLPKINNGSRVLITTRFEKVAEKADPMHNPYQLRILNEDESKELLLKKVFPNRFAHECPDYLYPQVNRCLKKCDGWPLALVVLGGILSTKNPDTWDETMKKLDWSTNGSDCMDIISTSYDDLPAHLKQCFMYFASFPEDYEIRVSRLIRMWIAEGFVQQETTETMEDTTMNYLEELVQRCMVQVSELNYLGKMKNCRIHDILHELAIKKSKENDFLTVYSNSTANSMSTSYATPVRRVAYHDFDIRRPMGATEKNLRSFIYVGNDFPEFNFELRMTRVVDSETLDSHGNRNYNVLNLKWLQHLSTTTLRYLRIVFHVGQGTNLSCLSHLKHLQMLEVRYLRHDKHNTFWNKHCSYLSGSCWKNNDFELSKSFWDNKMLRSVIWIGTGLLGPPASANLENMQRLEWVIAREEWGVKLPYFPHIIKLKLYLGEVEHCWQAISCLMSKLENMVTLKLCLGVRMTVITPAFRDFKQMHSLKLQGQWSENVGIDGNLPPNLVKLVLEASMIREDPMPELEKLPHLRVLELGWYSFMGEKLSCSRGRFRCLQHLVLGPFFDNLKAFIIEEGAMPMLNKLEMSYCRKLEMVPDLQYLTNLRDLQVLNMSSIFYSRLKGEDHHKVKHVPSIITS